VESLGTWRAGAGALAVRYARFQPAPPRRFVLPGVLLLLSEHPSHGYLLERGLKELCFGHIDRPAVYRALAQLEADGLVASAPERSAAGSARRVYCITPLGRDALRAWMSMVEEEHASLSRVLSRYAAAGGADALIAQVEGGWSNAVRRGWSPVSLSLARRSRRGLPVKEEGHGSLSGANRPLTYELVPERSVVLVEARSTMGPISFGALGLAGWVRAAFSGGELSADFPPAGHMSFGVGALSSGNGFYDAELARRVDVKLYPTVSVDLVGCSRVGGSYRLTGDLSFHGTTRRVQGTCDIRLTEGGRLLATGEQVFDMRDFSVRTSTVLMFRIYPDVRVRLQVEAEPGEVA
jgi:DNA-binding PadR family transcriptional regulator